MPRYVLYIQSHFHLDIAFLMRCSGLWLLFEMEYYYAINMVETIQMGKSVNALKAFVFSERVYAANNIAFVVVMN